MCVRDRKSDNKETVWNSFCFSCSNIHSFECITETNARNNGFTKKSFKWRCICYCRSYNLQAHLKLLLFCSGEQCILRQPIDIRNPEIVYEKRFSFTQRNMKLNFVFLFLFWAFSFSFFCFCWLWNLALCLFVLYCLTLRIYAEYQVLPILKSTQYVSPFFPLLFIHLLVSH